MSGRQFNMVSPAIWRSARFLGVSSDARALHLYLMTSPHQNSAGIYCLPDGYACSDLRWSPDVYHSSRAELVAAGLIAFDEETSEVYVLRWFQHCAPKGPKQQAGTQRLVEAIESDRLRELVESDYMTATEPAPAHSADVLAITPSNRLMATRMMGGRS